MSSSTTYAIGLCKHGCWQAAVAGVWTSLRTYLAAQFGCCVVLEEADDFEWPGVLHQK